MSNYIKIVKEQATTLKSDIILSECHGLTEECV